MSSGWEMVGSRIGGTGQVSGLRQVQQSSRSGQIQVVDVPVASLDYGRVRVATNASLISTGTEKSSNDFASATLLGKARSRPDLVQQVVRKARTDGLSSALEAAFSRLEEPMALGYSSSGEVLEVGPDVSGVRVGDRVACAGGGYASHASVVSVPRNLVVKIPDGVSYEQAAFATIGSVALEGIRVADLRVGERVVIIGLGLIGLLAVQLCKAAGCLVFGTDLDSERVGLALELGADACAVTSDASLEAAVDAFTEGRKADAVLITAATKSNEPTVLAGRLSRLRGRVVAVGDIRMDIPRRIYYEKGLQMRVSTSYGPGRYDPEYEEKGNDYPYAYVPFTEQRNMETFLNLVKDGRVTPERLITHRFPIDQAEEAYRVVRGETGEKPLGILFTYPETPDLNRTLPLQVSERRLHRGQAGCVSIGVIGAGNYARLMLLPELARMKESVALAGLAASTGLHAKATGEKFGFRYCTTDVDALVADNDIHAVVIATRHDSHASLAAKALEAGKHVFLEKPLAIHEDELRTLVDTVSESGKLLMVGFNRRFAPLVQTAKQLFQGHHEPLALVYRVNAGFIPSMHWTQDPEVGGGRIIGEACHFVDLAQFLVGADPVSVYAFEAESRAAIQHDTVSIQVRFADGSIATIHYFANGDKAIPKEYLEIHGEGRSFILDDFRRARYAAGERVRKYRVRGQDKGQAGELHAFVDAVRSGGENPIPLRESVLTTLVTFRALDSIRLRQEIAVGWQQ